MEKIVISAVILCLLFILVGEKKTSVGFESFGELVAAELGWDGWVGFQGFWCLNFWCKCCEVVCEVEGLWCDVVWCLWLTNFYTTMSHIYCQCIKNTHLPHTFHARFSVFGVVWFNVYGWQISMLPCHIATFSPWGTHTHTFHTFAEGEKKQYLFGHSSSELKISVWMQYLLDLETLDFTCEVEGFCCGVMWCAWPRNFYVSISYSYPQLLRNKTQISHFCRGREEAISFSHSSSELRISGWMQFLLDKQTLVVTCEDPMLWWGRLFIV